MSSREDARGAPTECRKQQRSSGCSKSTRRRVGRDEVWVIALLVWSYRTVPGTQPCALWCAVRSGTRPAPPSVVARSPWRPSPPPPRRSTPRGVRVRVHAAGLNFADLLMVAGQYQEKPSLPFIPGGEFAGIITEVGEDVLRSRVFRVGQAVAGVVTGGGAMADEAVIPDAFAGCLPVPDGMTLEQAAAFPVAYGTSHVALVHRANVGPGDRVLVLGAAGGVGLAAVQIAKARAPRWLPWPPERRRWRRVAPPARTIAWTRARSSRTIPAQVRTPTLTLHPHRTRVRTPGSNRRWRERSGMTGAWTRCSTPWAATHSRRDSERCVGEDTRSSSGSRAGKYRGYRLTSRW